MDCAIREDAIFLSLGPIHPLMFYVHDSPDLTPGLAKLIKTIGLTAS